MTTAPGKITAANVQVGTRILVASDESGALIPAKLKTGAIETSVTRVRPAGFYFEIETGVGVLRPLPGSRVFWRAKVQIKPVETIEALPDGKAEVTPVLPVEVGAQVRSKSGRTGTILRLSKTYTDQQPYAEMKWNDGTFGVIRTEFLESVS